MYEARPDAVEVDESANARTGAPERIRAESPHSPVVAERLRYLAAFAEHAALAGAFRLLRTPQAPLPACNRPLRAVFLSAYPGSHYGTVSRLTRWVPHLSRLGCEVEVLTPTSDAVYAEFAHGDSRADLRYFRSCIRNQWRNVRHARAADVVLLHRGLFPFTTWQRPTFERELARLNPRLIYDFYDAIWLQRQEAALQNSRAGRWLHPPDKIEEVLRLASVVTVSNDVLAEFARKHHSDVRIVPMLIDAEEYEPRKHEQRSPVVVGWLGGRYQIPRLLSLAPALQRLAARREIRVRVVTSETVEIPGVPVDSVTHAWSEASEREDLAALDVGLLPLEDSIHDRGKSPLKALQYSAAGVPFVAAPVALDLSVMKPGECFLAATTEEEWVSGMMRLVDDPVLRGRMGAAARRVVSRHYSFAGYAPAFLDVLRTAASSRPRASS